MPNPPENLRKLSIQLFIYVAVLLILLLSSINLSNYLSSVKILGASTEITARDQDLINQKSYWETFLKESPNYTPGWVELSKIDSELGNTVETDLSLQKAYQIDPNSTSLLP